MGRVRSLAYLAVFAVMALLALKYLLQYLFPFLAAVVLAIIIDPWVSCLEKRARLPRGVAVGLVLVALLGGAGGFAFFVLSALAVEAGELLRALPVYYEIVIMKGRFLEDRLGEVLDSLPHPVRAAIESQGEEIYRELQVALASFLDALAHVLRGLPALLATGAVSGLATFFLSRDKRMVRGFLLSLLPPAWRVSFSAVQREVFLSTLSYVKAQLVMVTVTASLTAAGLLLANAGYALMLGMVAGLLDLIPMVGPSIILVPWGVWSILGGNAEFGVKLVALAVLLALVRPVLEAKVLGSRAGAHPLAVLLALYLGFKVFGGPGLIIGPFVLILLTGMVRSGLLPPGGSR